jgi:hypothetical protein
MTLIHDATPNHTPAATSKTQPQKRFKSPAVQIARHALQLSSLGAWMRLICIVTLRRGGTARALAALLQGAIVENSRVRENVCGEILSRSWRLCRPPHTFE